MQDQTYISVRGLGVVVWVVTCCVATASHAQTCKTNIALEDPATKRICATWDAVGDPEILEDFTVDYQCTGCSDAPRVELRNGGSSTPVAWVLYSEALDGQGDPTGPEDLGDVTLNPTVASDKFKVSIKNGTGAGAVNVGSIVLDDAGFTGYSNLADTLITGNVAGAITLVKSFGGVGGEVTGVVGITGFVTGPISIPKVTGIVIIGGNVTNAIDIEEISGSFSVKDSIDITVSTSLSGSLSARTVPSGKIVTIQELTETGYLTLVTLGGRLELMNGIPSSCPSNVQDCPPGSEFADVIVSVLSDTGVIDLHGADMAGLLSLSQAQNNSRIIAVGAVSGFLYPALSGSGYFNGTLDVSSVSAISTHPGIDTGEIEVFDLAALNGIINVSGSIRFGGHNTYLLDWSCVAVVS